jgi:hypothetical protein
MHGAATTAVRTSQSTAHCGLSSAWPPNADVNPAADALEREIHVFLWVIVTVFVGLAMWSSRWLLASAGGVLVLSVAAERAQDILTQTRDLQAADLVASAGLGRCRRCAGAHDSPPARNA